MADNELQHFTFGYPIIDDNPAENPAILGSSEALDPEQVAALMGHVPLAPILNDDVEQSRAIALVTVPEEPLYLFAQTRLLSEAHRLPITQVILVPEESLNLLGGDVQPLIGLIDQPLDTTTIRTTPLAPLPMPTPVTWSMDKGVALVHPILEENADDDFTLLAGVLGAALGGRAIVRNFPANWQQRLRLVRGCMALLPLPARRVLTFTTGVADWNGTLPRVVFSEEAAPADALVIDWAEHRVPEEALDSAYITHLRSLWTGDVVALVEAVRTLDTLASYLMVDQTLDEGLQTVTIRHQRDMAIQEDRALDTDTIFSVLTGEFPPQGALRVRYVERLLEQSLAERNTDAAEFIAQELDQDPELSDHVQAIFEQALDSQPDAIYVFVRTRLSEGIEPRWLDLLHRAAERSLDVAISSGDPGTLQSWLRLISREPLRYELADVLKDGLLAARSRAVDSPELAEELLTISVRRQPDALPDLLNDHDVIEALPDHLQQVLYSFDVQAIDALGNDQREIFLLALTLAIHQGQPCISPTAVRNLWEILKQQNNNTLPPEYRPANIIQDLAQDDTCLLPGAMETLLMLMLNDEKDSLFGEVARGLAAQGHLTASLAPALEQSGRSPGDILEIVSGLAANEVLTPQGSVDVYSALLSDREWEEAWIKLVEQLARTLYQYPETETSPNILWKILEQASELKNEQMARMAQRRLLSEISEMVAEHQIVESIIRLRKAVSWNAAARAALIRWWREYAHNAPLNQLQKVERAMEGRRPLEEMRSIAQTAVAVRRIIGQRDMVQFAEDVNVAFTLLQAFSEAFDPGGRASMGVDALTIRNELEAHADELPRDSQQVLATNLKELAQLITTLADNRSKPSIMRNDTTVERLLARGEQQPQSAIDVLRWLSGYFGGLQRDEDEPSP